jgi:hypothetical protein
MDTIKFSYKTVFGACFAMVLLAGSISPVFGSVMMSFLTIALIVYGAGRRI